MDDRAPRPLVLRGGDGRGHDLVAVPDEEGGLHAVFHEAVHDQSLAAEQRPDLARGINKNVRLGLAILGSSIDQGRYAPVRELG